MKKTIIITILLLSINTLLAQNNNDIVNLSAIKINNTVSFNDTTTDLTAAIGNPQITETEYWEMSEENITNYIYLFTTYFQFANNSLKSFKICSGNFEVNIGATLLKVGNHINSLQSSFPNSYDNKEDGYISIGITPDDYQYILIGYNELDGIITSIEHRFY